VVKDEKARRAGRLIAVPYAAITSPAELPGGRSRVPTRPIQGYIVSIKIAPGAVEVCRTRAIYARWRCRDGARRGPVCDFAPLGWRNVSIRIPV
jgi:hypothetical protein